MENSFESEIDAAIQEEVGQIDEPRGDWERIGNSMFVATDGIGGLVQIRHDGDLKLGAEMSVDKVDVWSREAGVDIQVDHKPERQTETYPQSAGGPAVSYEADQDPPRGLMKTWELGQHRAELRFLRAPDTDEPFGSPWHVKVIGPDPLAGGRVDSIWSGSYDDRGEAEDAATRQLERKARDHQRREDKYGTERPQTTTMGYAVWDPETKGFARSGFYGQQVFETPEKARKVAESHQTVVALSPVHQG